MSDEQWHCFNQLAAVLRRHSVRPVRVLVASARRGVLTRLMDRWVYQGIVDLGRPGGVAELEQLVARSQVLDLQVNERSFQGIDPCSTSARLLERLDGSDWDGRVSNYDKIALSERLSLHGIRVAPVIRADSATTHEAITRLGLPIMVKSRTGTGGAEVRIAADAAATRAAVADLGGHRSQIFYQRYIDGDLVGYGAVIRDGSPIQEYAALELKAVSDPLGPTARARALDDDDIVEAGRAVHAIVGTEGFFSVEFMRSRDGDLFFIDMSTRVWGNFLSWTGAGLDFGEGYLHAIGANSTPPSTVRPRPDHLVAIFPADVNDIVRAASWTTAARAVWRGCRSYAPRVGNAYCALAATTIFVERVRRHRTQDRSPIALR